MNNFNSKITFAKLHEIYRVKRIREFIELKIVASQIGKTYQSEITWS